jgi:hypothetical protein
MYRKGQMCILSLHLDYPRHKLARLALNEQSECGSMFSFVAQSMLSFGKQAQN